MNALSGTRTVTPDPEKIRALWAELQTWVINRPDSLRPILEIDASATADEESAFATMIYSSTSAGMIFVLNSC